VATSVSFTLDLQVDMAEKDTSRLVAQGQMNFVQDSIEAVVTVPYATPGPPAFDAGIMPVNGPMQLRTEWVDDHAYMTAPSSWSALTGGARTLSIPVSPTMVRTMDTVLAQSAVALTYANILFNELTAHETVQRVPNRTIGGIPTRGTRANLTLAQLLKLVPELAPNLTSDLTAMAHETIPVTVWVDTRGRLVEVVMTGKGDGASVSGAVQFSHDGAPDKVTVPPAGTVKPIPAALRQSSGFLYFF